MANYRILVTDTLYPNLDYERTTLASIGAEVVLASSTDPETLIREGHNCDGMLVEYATVSQEVLSGLTRCKIIVRTAIGYDNIDVATATRQGIMVANVPDYCIEEVSEHALALLLACGRRVVHFNRQVKDGVWNAEAGGAIRRLSTQTLGLVGFGAIARRFAQKAAPLGLRILVYDPYLPFECVAAAGVTQVATLEHLAQESDFLSLHVPFTPANKNMVSDSLLEKMKSSAYLLNTSRGGLVDLDALTRALKYGNIAGAALDVLSTEPPPSTLPILQMENVIITPHCGYYSEDANEELRAKATRQIVEAFTVGKPSFLLNP